MIKRYLKIFGKIVLVIFLAFLVLLWRACFWYPYKIEKYINPNFEKVDFAVNAILDLPRKNGHVIKLQIVFQIF